MNPVRAALIRSGHDLAEPVTRLWQQWRADRPASVVRLDDVRRRLELLLAGLYGRDIRIDVIQAPAHGWMHNQTRRWMRYIAHIPSHVHPVDALACNDGHSIRLPNQMRSTDEGQSAFARYRLLALGQAERVVRGTAFHAPNNDSVDLLERDLYLLCESVAVDAVIANAISGMVPSIENARAGALAHRPRLDRMMPMERETELLVRAVLTSKPTDNGHGITPTATPWDSLAWARARAAAIRKSSAPGARYRGTAPISVWGTVSEPWRDPGGGSVVDVPQNDDHTDPSAPGVQPRTGNSKPREYKRRPSYSAPDASQIMAQVASENGAEREMSPQGTGKPDRDVHDDSADSTNGVESTAPLTEKPGTGPRAEQSLDMAGTSVASAAAHPDSESVAVEYPEWDCYAGRYRARGATVRVSRHATADHGWARDALEERGVLVRRIRERFERLRSQRVRLTRQRDGEELDIAACVDALVDRRAGRTPDDRLYVSVRPGRRALAIALLVDVSGSTDTPVGESLRVIDVEKIAVLLASEAFDALRDAYTILTFSSMGENNVDVSLIKDFAERNGNDVRQRISAIAPGGNTRLGAAVRHANALLAAQPAGHRLLLILSDGKPNDTDRYFEQYAVEDTRQAVIDGRAQGVFPFCLTVDAHEPEQYLTHIFGRTGHAILRRPEQLSLALLQVVRQILGQHQA